MLTIDKREHCGSRTKPARSKGKNRDPECTWGTPPQVDALTFVGASALLRLLHCGLRVAGFDDLWVLLLGRNVCGRSDLFRNSMASARLFPKRPVHIRYVMRRRCMHADSHRGGRLESPLGNRLPAGFLMSGRSHRPVQAATALAAFPRRRRASYLHLIMS